MESDFSKEDRMRISSLGEQNQRRHEFDYLRALAVLVLLFHHSGIYHTPLLGISLETMQPYGSLFINGVFLFLSGYFSLISLQHREGDLFAFYRSKFIRIYPPYLVALLLFVYLIGYSLRKRDLFIYLIGMQTVFSPAVAKPLLTIWFIGVLGLFFFVFGLLMYVFRTDVHRVLGAVALFVAAYIIRILTGLIDDRFFLYFFVFLMGVVVARSAWLTGFLLSPHWLPGKFAILLAGFSGYWLVLDSGVEPISIPYIVAADIFILLSIVFFLALFARSTGQPHPLWGRIAKASYFTYLFHRPVWHVCQTLVDVPPGGSEALLNLLPGSLLTLFLAYYLQKGYDRLVSKLKW
ncbi:MAG: acyltransferase family protein [Chloroflexota bacterium]